MLKPVPSWMGTTAWTGIIVTFSEKLISAFSNFESKYECISLYYYLQNHPWGMKSFCVSHIKVWQLREGGATLQNSCSTAKYGVQSFPLHL